MNNVPKSYQYISIDSRLLPNNNTFTLNFMQPSFNGSGSQDSSNIFLHEIDSIIGLKLIDFNVSNTNSTTLSSTGVQTIDILCPTIPTKGQMSDNRHGFVFDKIFLDRDGSTIYHSTYHPNYRKDGLFNPIPLSKMEFNLYNTKDNGVYERLDPNVSFVMNLEFISINKIYIEDELITSIRSLNKAVNKLKAPSQQPQQYPQYYYPHRV